MEATGGRATRSLLASIRFAPRPAVLYTPAEVSKLLCVSQGIKSEPLRSGPASLEPSPRPLALAPVGALQLGSCPSRPWGSRPLRLPPSHGSLAALGCSRAQFIFVSLPRGLRLGLSYYYCFSIFVSIQ